MTKENIQYVRERMGLLIEFVRRGGEAHPEDCKGCGIDEAVLALLDAELEKGEEKEWRVAWVGGPDAKAPGKPNETMAYLDSSKAENALAELSKIPRIYANVHIETRTPASPWTPQL